MNMPFIARHRELKPSRERPTSAEGIFTFDVVTHGRLS
jgi:hypothetical protein